MHLFLIRHTRVDVPAGMIYGQTDVPLQNTFEEEAAIIINNLPEHFDAVYSSPSIRCRKLAERISEKIIIDPRLMELNFGKWEGKLWNEIDQTKAAQKWFNDYLNEKCPGGESYAELLNRINDFLLEIKNKNYREVCIITHGGPLRVFLSIINHESPQKVFNKRIEYGEIIRLRSNPFSS